MGLNKYTSEVKLIDHNQQVVFNYLSNFENLGTYLNSGLIENSVKGSNLYSSVVGIGMNVNQKVFMSGAPNPVSLFQITGEIYDNSDLLKKLLLQLESWYNELLNEETAKINRTYLSRLYRYNEWSLFIDSDKQKFEARIIDIGKFGQLILELRDNSKKEFMFKEIEFVL